MGLTGSLHHASQPIIFMTYLVVVLRTKFIVFDSVFLKS